MLNNLKKGDRIITSGGIIGKISKVSDNRELSVEITDQVEINIAPGMVADIYTPPEKIKKQIESNSEKKPGLFAGIFGNKK